MKYLILTMMIMFSTVPITKSETKTYYEMVITGIPCGKTNIGGVYKKTEVEICNHKSTIEQMKAQAIKNSNRWEFLSYILGLLSIGFVLVWYFTKISKMSGASILCLGLSFTTLIISELVLATWIIVVIGGAIAGLIGIGYMLRHKTISNLWRKKK